MKVYIVRHSDAGNKWCCYISIDGLQDELEALEPADISITIHAKEMTEEEVNGLPEFEGW